MVEEKEELVREENAIINLKKLYDESEDRITANAVISRAFTDRISMDSINQKVEAQMNAIKSNIVEAMASYENALIELSKFYDTKIEQLILRKVELEASLMGIIINDEYLYQKEIERGRQKENDKVKSKITEGIKKVIDKLRGKDDQKPVDLRLINTVQDSKELEMEISEKMSQKLEQTKNASKDNKEQLSKVEKEIRLIDEEIKRLNKLKKESLYNAMEAGGKSLDVKVKKPHVFGKITRFFSSRFNTPKVVNQTIIEPLNKRIEDFRSNELLNMKGE